MIDKVLAIQNCGPSGTTLLQSLMDGHSHVLSLPALHGRELLVFWEHNWTLKKEDLFNKFMQDFAFLYDPQKMTNELGLMDMGPQHDEIAVADKDLFSTFLLEQWSGLEALTRKHFIVSVFVAYNRAIGRQINDDSFILYPIHSLPQRYATYLVEDFHTVRFLHTVREPIQSIGSAARHIKKKPFWSHHYLLSCVTAPFFSDYTIHVDVTPRPTYGMTAYVEDTKDGRVQTIAIKLEDIHKETKKIMSLVCDWLGLDWEETLLVSTFNGKLWHNRPESIRQTGTGSQTISQQHHDVLSAFDKWRLNFLAVPFKRHFEYPVLKQHTSTLYRYLLPLLLLLPFKMEMSAGLRKHWRQYLKCRKDWLIPAWKNVSNCNINFIRLLTTEHAKARQAS